MNTLDQNRRVQFGVLVTLMLLLGPRVSLGSELSPRKYNFFLALYKELHSGNLPPEGGLANPERWAVEEKDRLEPIVVAILRGEHKDIPWNYALAFAAPLMPTKLICDEVYARMDSLFSKKLAAKAPIDEREHGTLSTMVSVLATGNDKRATSALNELLRRDEYSYHTGRKYVLAVRKVGDATSLQALREMPLRKTNERFDRLCVLTERMIDARVAGNPFPPEPITDELRAAASRFLKACEAADLQAYNACFPWGFHKVRDEGDMHEFVDGEHGEPSLAAIQAALEANTPFEIDRENLQAKLLCDGLYYLEYIYEVDGWKVMNVRPARPAVRTRAPIEYPKTSGKRIFIGKPAKDSQKP